MPLDTAIQNVGEYYSSHYLDTSFAKEKGAKALLKQWKEQGANASPRRLAKLGQRYFKAKAQALETKDWNRRRGAELESWPSYVLQALGYDALQPMDWPVVGGKTYIPTLGMLKRFGQPWLVVCKAVFCIPDGSLPEQWPIEDPLESVPAAAQLVEADHTLFEKDWNRSIGELFKAENRPRWVMLLGGSRLLLIDSKTFANGRWLAFDLDDAFGRKEKGTFDQITTFLSRETLAPESESTTLIHDTLEENSHKLAHGVTESLQASVREAIGLLANEWVADRRRRKRSIFTVSAKDLQLEDSDGTKLEVTAEQLRLEALTYVYRLIFCFYAEAHGPELGILPINDDAYRLGYSLESLRDLELVPLSEQAVEGTYFHEHLSRLFMLIHQGFHPQQAEANPDQFLLQLAESTRTFVIPPLTATLFDPKATPLLSQARLSNQCLQQVIKCLSLSYDEKTKTTGRVNYGVLGINQLGAVYEGLLSFSGMFAAQDLIQVKRAKDDFGKTKTQTWFVPKERAEEFTEKEVERLPGGKPRIYPKGEFILHLSGLDREQSASYYTPEVLTKCLVEETLRPLLKDYTPEDADKILTLTVCEPAMGSGAFLNEAANQLAEKYLELKQQQLAPEGKSIDPVDYPNELRRVRHYITTRNLYGVDLNPTAVELGALSLWLNTMHRVRVVEAPAEEGEEEKVRYVRGATPWFGLRLRAGNSLIGARRAVWTKAQLLAGVHLNSGDEAVEPRQLKPGEARGDEEVYHYLVFDPDMVPTAKDRLVRQYQAAESDKAKDWLKRQVKADWTEPEIDLALTVSELIDGHEQRYAQERLAALEKTKCPASVWPQPVVEEAGPSLQVQEQVKASLEAASGSFQRLKLLMDSWCGLFFWSLDEVEALPRREDFLEAAQILLGQEEDLGLKALRLNFDGAELLKATAADELDVEVLMSAVPWYRVSGEIASETQFNHWELAFPEILGQDASQSNGFDLVVGNPPWIKVSWSDAPLLCDFDPLLGVRAARSADFNQKRTILIQSFQRKTDYLNAQRLRLGIVTFLNCHRMYEVLRGGQTNLYKNFAVRSWAVLGSGGFGGLLHQESPYDDAKGGRLRAAYYRRLVAHFHFRNELKLFDDIHDQSNFSINIFKSCFREKVSFTHLVNLYTPTTINACRNHVRREEPVPGLKTDDSQWATTGHQSRLISVTEETLKTFHMLLEDKDTPINESRLLQVHSLQLVRVIQKINQSPRWLVSLNEEYLATEMFHETDAQKDGIITRMAKPSFQPKEASEWIVSGPHFYVGNPFNKSAKNHCDHNNAYDDIDLTLLESTYLPKSAYKPGCLSDNHNVFSREIPDFLGNLVTTRYRYINRRRAGLSNERTLISSILPPGAVHINLVLSLTFESISSLLAFAGSTLSLIFDFLLRTSGRSDIYGSTLQSFPEIPDPWLTPVMHRGLRISSLTVHYANLWDAASLESLTQDQWASSSEVLQNATIDWNTQKSEAATKNTPTHPIKTYPYEAPWSALDPHQWTWHSPLRSDYARRQALLEIDVLVSLALGLTLDELQTIYRVQFPVMRQYEIADEYDAHGRLIPSTHRKAAGGKEVRTARKDWDEQSPLTVSWQIDDGNQTVTKTFHPPFTRVDREADYEYAYDFFKAKYGIKQLDTENTPVQ